jgi:anti-sigma factor RsiW
VTDHHEARELLPELAANIADADDRSAGLEHLADCPPCRAELAQLAGLLDDLLVLAPPVEPLSGFAEAVLARLSGPGDPARDPPVDAGRPSSRPRRRLPPVLLAAAALVAAGLAAGVGGAVVWQRTATDRELADGFRHTLQVAHGDELQAAPLYGADGTEIGTVFAYQGSPSWLYVTFRAKPDPGKYDVALVTANGSRLPLRAFTATATSTGWGRTVKVEIKTIRTLRFAGATLPTMTARFA